MSDISKITRILLRILKKNPEIHQRGNESEFRTGSNGGYGKDRPKIATFTE